VLLRHALMPIAVTGLFLAARATRAQAPDSIAFHRGQWGTEFTTGGGFAAAGLLHFTSLTHALLVDFGANYDHNTSSVNTHSGTVDAVAATVRLGTRAYRFFDRRLYRFTTLGITGNYQWQRNTQDSLRSASMGLGGGVFADVGASWPSVRSAARRSHIGTLGAAGDMAPGSHSRSAMSASLASSTSDAWPAA
jgi:hypothetical protein